MSSTVLLLLVNVQIFYNDMDAKLIGMLTGTTILMQLLAPGNADGHQRPRGSPRQPEAESP